MTTLKSPFSVAIIAQLMQTFRIQRLHVPVCCHSIALHLIFMEKYSLHGPVCTVFMNICYALVVTCPRLWRSLTHNSLNKVVGNFTMAFSNTLIRTKNWYFTHISYVFFVSPDDKNHNRYNSQLHTLHGINHYLRDQCWLGYIPLICKYMYIYIYIYIYNQEDEVSPCHKCNSNKYDG